MNIDNNLLKNKKKRKYYIKYGGSIKTNIKPEGKLEDKMKKINEHVDQMIKLINKGIKKKGLIIKSLSNLIKSKKTNTEDLKKYNLNLRNLIVDFRLWDEHIPGYELFSQNDLRNLSDYGEDSIGNSISLSENVMQVFQVIVNSYTTANLQNTDNKDQKTTKYINKLNSKLQKFNKNISKLYKAKNILQEKCFADAEIHLNNESLRFDENNKNDYNPNSVFLKYPKKHTVETDIKNLIEFKKTCESVIKNAKTDINNNNLSYEDQEYKSNFNNRYNENNENLEIYLEDLNEHMSRVKNEKTEKKQERKEAKKKMER